VVALFRHELRGPRRRTAVTGGPVRSEHVVVRSARAKVLPQRRRKRAKGRARAAA
jgi:hypothetical protein